MRMRKKKNLQSRMEACRCCWITDPQARKGHWRELFPQAKQIRVEVGCGKGRFTMETAKAEPDILLIAVEKVPDAMVVAMERCRDAGLTNVFFVDGDAASLPDLFEADEVDRLYINFCDPWPRSNQARRRLTHGNFLQIYRKVLKLGGQIHFKTDNDKLFAWSVEEIPQFGFSLSEVTTDLHADGPVGVMTDYEAKFYAEGKNINRCVATMDPWEPSFPATLHELKVRWVDAFAGDADQFDDITMLCVKLTERAEPAVMTVVPTSDSVSSVAEFLEEQLDKLEVPMKKAVRLKIALDEIYSNIVRYSGADHAQVECLAENGVLSLVFRDNGKPYNPLEAEEPDITAAAEDRAIGGLGILMVRKMMDKVDYMYKDGQNILTLWLNIEA